MGNRSRSLRTAVLAALLLVGASVVAATPASTPDSDKTGFFERVERALGAWRTLLPFGGLRGVKQNSTTPQIGPATEPVPTSSTAPAVPPSAQPAAEDGPHWDPNG